MSCDENKYHNFNIHKSMACVVGQKKLKLPVESEISYDLFIWFNLKWYNILKPV
jgi:hypothetical protein